MIMILSILASHRLPRELIVPGAYGVLKLADSEHRSRHNPDSKVHGANMGPIWGQQDPGGPHVGPMDLAIWK